MLPARTRGARQVPSGPSPDLMCTMAVLGHPKCWSEGHSDIFWFRKKNQNSVVSPLKTASAIQWGEQRGNRVKQLYSRVPDLVIYIPEFKDLLPMSPTKESVLCPEKYIFGAVLIHFK